MSGVSKILTPHPLVARRVCNPPPLVRGEDTLARWRGGGGSIVWKTPDTALYSTYVSTLWLERTGNLCFFSIRKESLKRLYKVTLTSQSHTRSY
jgi:hypothetical protein